MRRYFVFLISFFYCSLSIAQPSKISYAPPNPEFEEYLKFNSLEYQKIFKLDDQKFGLAPLPFLIEEKKNTAIHTSANLPSKYDLRWQNNTTPVKNQESMPGCWAFATLGSIESRWRMLGYGIYDLSEKNLFYGHDYTINWGGNYLMATSYFIRGSGPILEVDDPFKYPANKLSKYLIPQFYIPEVSWVLGQEAIKQALYDYGAAYIAFYWESRYYNSLNYTYFRNIKTWAGRPGHAVVLIGWDDDKVTDGGVGAWIVKNSWGSSFGDLGYFYISYQDSSLNNFTVFWPKREPYNRNMIIHQYDYLGRISAIGFKDSTAYGLIKFSIPGNQKITRLGTWVLTGSVVSFELYGSFDGTVLSNKLGELKEYYCKFGGYKVFNLTTPIEIQNDQDIYIKVKYYTPGYILPISVEMARKDYSDPIIETGKCWISENGKDGSWIKVGSDTEYKFDLCIKAYSEYISSPINYKNTILSQNYPNPFNNKTTIFLKTPKDEKTTLEIFNSIGERIVIDDVTNVYKYEWIPKVSSGIYFYRVSTSTRIETLKMIYLK